MARHMSLRTQLLALQLGVVALTVAIAGSMALWLHARAVREAHLDQLRATALAVAALPSIAEAYATPDPAARIQQIAELVRQAGPISQVVVTDVAGRRYSHPNPALIGTVDPFDPDVPGAGELWAGAREGVMGEVMRVKVPVYGKGGAVIGSVSAGQLTELIDAEVWGEAPVLIPWLVAVGLVGALGAGAISHRMWRRVYRQEPREIARALQAREAMLHAIGEAVVVVDSHGIITLVNDEAMRLFGVGADAVGRPAREVLEPGVWSAMWGAAPDGVASLADAAPEPDDDQWAPYAVGPPPPDSVSQEPTPSPPVPSGSVPLEPVPAAPVPLTHVGPGAAGQLVLAGEHVVLAQRASATVEGQAVGEILVARDHTELSAALADLAGARDLTDALRAQAHEFAGRLHVIAGLLQLGEVDEAQRFIASVSLDGHQLEAGVAQLGDPDLSALLLAKAALATERDVALVLDPGSRAQPDGTLDAATIVSNLVDNALDATGADGHVSVWLDCGPDRLHIRVADDGPGVPPEARTRIFATGFSTKGSGGARGFGLALVARIVRRRGGQVRVGEGPGGRGAMFEVDAPGVAAEPGVVSGLGGASGPGLTSGLTAAGGLGLASGLGGAHEPRAASELGAADGLVAVARGDVAAAGRQGTRQAVRDD